MARAQLTVVAGTGEREEKLGDGAHYPVTQSGFMPRAVEATFLSPASYVLRSLRLHEALAELTAHHLILCEEEQVLRTLADACIALDDVALAMFKVLGDFEAALEVACLLRATVAAAMELPHSQIRSCG